MGFDNIKDISPSKGDWRFEARITRMWQLTSYKDHVTPYQIEMVLLDSNV